MNKIFYTFCNLFLIWTYIFFEILAAYVWHCLTVVNNFIREEMFMEKYNTNYSVILKTLMLFLIKSFQTNSKFFKKYYNFRVLKYYGINIKYNKILKWLQVGKNNWIVYY